MHSRRVDDVIGNTMLESCCELFASSIGTARLLLVVCVCRYLVARQDDSRAINALLVSVQVALITAN